MTSEEQRGHNFQSTTITNDNCGVTNDNNNNNNNNNSAGSCFCSSFVIT